jgi:hypothetical protein
MRARLTAIATLLATAALALPAAAGGQAIPAPIGPWDGTNPFNCLNQDVGTGTDFPEPAADPFCVEFDKTQQNVTDFGLVDFLAKEPTRVAAAVTKCFYYQHDHWTGSIVQGSGPEVWNWIGSYFFDRAKGIGGVHVTDLRVGGTPMDASPFVPPAYQPYVEPTGGGGAIVLLETDPDPVCGALVDTPEEREAVYASEPRYKRCIAPGGQVHRRRVGKVALGMSAADVRKRIGPARKRKGFTQRWCVEGGSSLRVHFHKREAGRDEGAPRGAALILTTNPGHSFKRVGPGSKRTRAVRRLGVEPAFDIGRVEVLASARDRRRTVIAGVKKGRVRWLGLVDPNRIPGDRRLRATLRQAR